MAECSSVQELLDTLRYHETTDATSTLPLAALGAILWRLQELTYVPPLPPTLAPKHHAARTGRRAPSGKLRKRTHGISQTRAYFEVDPGVQHAVESLLSAVALRTHEADVARASTVLLALGLLARRSKAWLKLAGVVRNSQVVHDLLASAQASFRPRCANPAVRPHYAPCMACEPRVYTRNKLILPGQQLFGAREICVFSMEILTEHTK
jgi:hypothetical protein